MTGRTATVITASDGVTHGTRQDTSGETLATMLTAAGATVTDRVVVADEIPAIRAAVTSATETGGSLVVITGGTGLGPRDVTPEAVAGLTDRAIPGFGEAMRTAGRASTPLADLSRSFGAAMGTCIVVGVPGSPRGASESLGAVMELIPHVLDLLGGDTAHRLADDQPPASSQTTAGAAALTPDHMAARDHGPDHDHMHDHHPGHEEHDGAHADGHVHDDHCAVAHGGAGDHHEGGGTLMAVFGSPLAAILLAWGRELGWDVVLVDPSRAPSDGADGGLRVVPDPSPADAATDIVVTDHHRDELVDMLDVALDTPARFIGLMGSKRVEGPHIGPLGARGRSAREIARITRPIGVDIGSRTPAEIAVSTLADLIARRTGRTP